MTTQTMPITVEFQAVSQGYGRRRVLSDLSFRLSPGVTALVGPNGAGKTTLMRTVTTLLPPRAGSVSIAGTPVTSRGSVRQARSRIGFLPQGFDADPSFSVGDTVTYAAWLRQLPRAGIPEAVDRALESVALRDHAKTRVRKLSGGMKQRLGIACAVVGAPPVLVLDEPTVGLDPEQRLTFRETIRSFPHATVLLSTHLIEDVAALADRVILLADGRIRFDGSLDELCSHAPGGPDDPQSLDLAYLAVTRTAR